MSAPARPFHAARPTRLSGLAAACVALVAAGAAFADAPRPKISVTRLERAIHVLINHERRTRGLEVLAWDGPLADVARGHSRDMAGRDYFAHESPEGDGFMARYRKARYTCALRVGNAVYRGAENIARMGLYDSVTIVNGVRHYAWTPADKIARQTVAAWMASPGHRANILTPAWRHEGIGLVVAPDGHVYVTENFC